MSAHDSGLKDARDQLSLVLSFFPRVDAKLSTVLGINTGMLAALGLSFPPLQKMTPLLWIAPVLALALLIASYIQLYQGGFPTVKGGDSSLIYFREIAKRTEAGFVEEYLGCIPEAMSRDVLGQVWRNAEILSAKYDSLKLAFRFTAIGTVFWIISLALFSLSRANVQVTVGH